MSRMVCEGPHKRVQLGIVGLGPHWEHRYRHAVRALERRLVVRAIYDPVLGRAQLAAQEFQAEAVPGLRQLFERADIQGVLVFDSKWAGLYPAELACELQKPAFLAGSLGEDLASLKRLHEASRAVGVTLMAEFSLRHMPATCRLRELLATRLGAVQHLKIEMPTECRTGMTASSGNADLLLSLIDWCGYLCGRNPVLLTPHYQVHPMRSPWVIGYSPDASGKPQIMAELCWSEVPGTQHVAASPQPISAAFAVDQGSARPLLEVRCTHGQATIERPDEIRWQNGAEPQRESLASERTDAEVMLDQFCRRVVGGLIPVADISDVCRSLEWVRALTSARMS